MSRFVNGIASLTKLTNYNGICRAAPGKASGSAKYIHIPDSALYWAELSKWQKSPKRTFLYEGHNGAVALG